MHTNACVQADTTLPLTRTWTWTWKSRMLRVRKVNYYYYYYDYYYIILLITVEELGEAVLTAALYLPGEHDHQSDAGEGILSFLNFN